jgi:hypothetical protein
MIALALIIAGLFIMARAGVQLLFMGIWGVLGVGLLYLMITMDMNTVWLLTAAVIAILLFTKD